MKRQLFLAFCGTLVLVVPAVDWRVKIPVAAIATVPLSLALYKTGREYDEKCALKDSLTEELKNLEIESKKVQVEIDRQRQQVSKDNVEFQEKLAVLAADRLEIEKVRTGLNEECILKLKECDLTIHKRLNELLELEQQAAIERKNQMSTVSVDIELERGRLAKEKQLWEQEKQRIQKQIQQSLSDIDAEKEKLRIQAIRKKNQDLAELSQRIVQAKSEIEAYQIQVNSEIEVERAQINSERMLWDAEKIRSSEILARERLEWERQLEEEKQVHEQQLAQRRQVHLKSVGQEQQEIILEIAAEKAKPYIEELREAKSLIDKLRNEVRAARETVAFQKKVIKPEPTDQITNLAWRIITFFDDRGVKLNYVNIYEHEKKIYLIFDPADWFYHGGFQMRILKKFYDELIDQFKLESAPVAGHSPQGMSLELTLRSPLFLTQDYVGQKAFTPNFEGDDFSGVFNMDEVFVKAQEQIDRDDFEEEMIDFIEPLTFSPRSGDITSTEKKWVKFLYFYRLQYTGKPNITNQNDLLQRVWGVTAGAGTDETIQEDGRTLRSRLHLIFDLLGIEHRSKRKER